MHESSLAGGGGRGALKTLLSVLDKPSARMPAIFSALISLAVLIAATYQIRDFDLGDIGRMLPAGPWFWIVFVAWYLAGPASEWVIYRRLWRVPASGASALLRKMVTNELLLGYLGEAQFYAWARSHLRMEAAPFGAIKDVTIPSALTGNVATLLLLASVLPIVLSGALGMGMQTTLISLAVVLISSFAVLLLRHKLFSLPASELRFITVMHGLRIVAKVGLGAWLWHLALPDVALSQWLVLSTLRMLVSRLPLVPNKDVAFAAIGIMLLGHEAHLASLLAMIGGLVLIAHVIIGAAFGVLDLSNSWRRR